MLHKSETITRHDSRSSLKFTLAVGIWFSFVEVKLHRTNMQIQPEQELSLLSMVELT